MKIKLIAASLFLLVWYNASSQHENINTDSLKHLLSIAKDDTTRVIRMAALCHDYGYIDYDSAMVYGDRAMRLSEKITFNRGKARVYFGLGCAYANHGDLSKALDEFLKGLKIAEEQGYEQEQAACLQGMGFTYKTLSDNTKALQFFKRAREINQRTLPLEGLDYIVWETEIGISNSFQNEGQWDSAMIVLQAILKKPLPLVWRAVGFQALGDVYTLQGDYSAARSVLQQSLAYDIKNEDFYSISWASISLADLYKKMNQKDSCVYYSKKGLEIAQKYNIVQNILTASLLLAEQYETLDVHQSLYYRKIYDAANTELFGAKKVLSLQKTILDEQDREKAMEAKRLAKQNLLRQYLFLAGIVILFLIAFLLFRNNVQKQKANAELLLQKEEIQNTLSQLKSTQSQLIQAEKMASLGELTAGIAHEIQNPLNFVNNFSDVNIELIDEMREHLALDNKILAMDTADDIKSNLEKITIHGRRADSIVKGMLQHSRKSTGIKEPTDINALADEYLRLAYHGMRAKQKNSPGGMPMANANFKTDLDPTIGEVNVIPQDIGRVFLNLITNAFHSVAEEEKKKLDLGISEGYNPIVTVSTKKLSDKLIEIRIKDNGAGIPKHLIDKIFQPFFTTKPTGQGTGLGLSLAYDIVKMHGGSITVNSKEARPDDPVGRAEGAEFVIQLPLV